MRNRFNRLKPRLCGVFCGKILKMKGYIKELTSAGLNRSKENEIRLPISEMVKKIGRVTFDILYWPVEKIEKIGRRKTN